MAKTKSTTTKKSASKKIVKKVAKKTSAKKPATKTKLIPYWGLVTLNKTEAFIHLAFNSPISPENLEKWDQGYLASLLQANALILNASIVNDWKVEKMDFEREDPEWKEEDFPFWVGRKEADGIFNEIIKLNT